MVLLFSFTCLVVLPSFPSFGKWCLSPLSCWVVLLGLLLPFGWCCCFFLLLLRAAAFLPLLRSPSLLLGDVAWSPASLGGVAIPLSFGVVLPSFPFFGRGLRSPSLLMGGAAWCFFWGVVLLFSPSAFAWCCLPFVHRVGMRSSSLLLGGVAFLAFPLGSAFLPLVCWVALLGFPPLGGVAVFSSPFGGIAFLFSFDGWSCFFSPLQLGGAAWFPPSLGGVAFLALPLGSGVFLSSSVGWCCLVSSSFGQCCFSNLLSGGAAFLSILWSGAALSLSSVGSCFVSSSFGRCCFSILLSGGAAFLPLLWVVLLGLLLLLGGVAVQNQKEKTQSKGKIENIGKVEK